MARMTHSQVVAGLVQRGVPQHIAEGVAMNFRDESNFNTAIRGDNGNAIGLAQWNGPRMARLGAFAAARGKPIDDPDVQLDFFMHENATSEREAWNQVVNSNTPQEAATKFVNLWERPAAQHASARSAKYGGASADTYSPAPTSPNVGSTIDFLRAEEEAATGVPALGSPKAFPDQGGYVTGAPGTQANPLVTVEKKKNKWEAFGKGIADIKMDGMRAPSLPPGPTEPARVDAPAVAPLAPVDPARRQMLAQLMAQLNSGRLFG